VKASAGESPGSGPEVDAPAGEQEPLAAADKASDAEAAQDKRPDEEGQAQVERDDALETKEDADADNVIVPTSTGGLSTAGGFTSFAASTSAPFGALAAGTSTGFSFGGATGFGNGTFGGGKIGTICPPAI
jgi:hypothetical protein